MFVRKLNLEGSQSQLGFAITVMFKVEISDGMFVPRGMKVTG
jgi:hypothetical protein